MRVLVGLQSERRLAASAKISKHVLFLHKSCYYLRLVRISSVEGMIHPMPRRDDPLRRARVLLGPLEARLMELIWAGRVAEPFIVRDVLALTPELAYTTVMTTLNRLADKGLLEVSKAKRHQAHRYRARWGVQEFVDNAGRAEVERLVERYGDVALAAFADRLDRLSPATRDALRRLRTR